MTPSSPTLPKKLRMGPRPLPLHLMAAATTYGSSNAALPLLSSGLLSWSPALASQGADLQKALEKANPDTLRSAVEAEARRRLDVFLKGVERYRHHPYRRDLPAPPTVWQDGNTRLYDFGVGGGVPLLLIPSLINRAYILDLSARHSFARWMAEQGVWPFLVDWDAPNATERQFDLTAYITRRLEPALDAVRDLSGAAPIVLGYCMGGVLALALAQRRQESISGLALLATPWDFHAGNAAQASAMAGVAAAMNGVMTVLGELPVDVIQMLFASLDPFLAERKFSAFAALGPDTDHAEDFVALEDWLNDGVPLSAPVARECLIGWYGGNTTMRGQWRIAGAAVDPGAVDLPALVVVPANDRIVPPQSAMPLGAALPRAEVMQPTLGHIGMMVSRGVADALWPKILDWMLGHAPAD